MSTFEASYKSLLQGVSQQLPEERLPGQVTAQVNMVSDPVTGLRRRPGAEVRFFGTWGAVQSGTMCGWYTDLAGQRVHILLNTSNGEIFMLDDDLNGIAFLDGGEYLTNPDPTRIRAASVGNEFFLGNLDKVPEMRYRDTVGNPENSGFFYIAAGAFGKGYSVDLVYPGGSVSAVYTTPGGTGAGDAAQATPEYIAEQLVNQLSTGAFNRVRFTALRKTYEDGPQYALNLQYNTGSPIAPNWTDVAYPFEIDVSQINNNYLRIRHNGTRARCVLDFQVRIGAVWNGTPYSTDEYVFDSPYPVITERYVGAAALTSKVPTSGDPALFIQRDGPYVFVSRTGGLSVNTSVGQAFMVASKGQTVSDVGLLPARLPSAANGFICKVGTGKTPQYYQYNQSTTSWDETSAYGSPRRIDNCPISIIWNGTNWAFNRDAYEGRNAGDDESNPAMEFMQYGITGMGTYQGRLVLLSGPMVSLSAAGHPRRFFRSTVTGVINSDPIEIGSSMASAAAYEWAIPFQKDLLLFSSAYQAVLPSGNAAVTPTTATVVPTSAHETDTTSSPIVLGRTLMYCAPRSEDFFGVMEMIPSPYTDSQYVSQDATPHLPKYMGGRCRFAVSSGVSSLAMVAPSGDPYSLVIHEYHWDGDEKRQQAWHQWTFPYKVQTAYFASDTITVVFGENDTVAVCILDPRAGRVQSTGERRPFLDVNIQLQIVDNIVQVPAWLRTFDPNIAQKCKLSFGTGPLAGEEVGFTVEGTNLRTVRSFPNGPVFLGVPYYSGVIPTPPVIRDYNDNVIHGGKATLLRYGLGTRNSSQYEVVVTDAYSDGDDLVAPVLTFSSPELELGRALRGDKSISIVPCRTDLRSTAMEVSTDKLGELNITSLEYVAKFHQQIKRR